MAWKRQNKCSSGMAPQMKTTIRFIQLLEAYFYACVNTRKEQDIQFNVFKCNSDLLSECEHITTYRCVWVCVFVFGQPWLIDGTLIKQPVYCPLGVKKQIVKQQKEKNEATVNKIHLFTITYAQLRWVNDYPLLLQWIVSAISSDPEYLSK